MNAMVNVSRKVLEKQPLVHEPAMDLRIHLAKKRAAAAAHKAVKDGTVERFNAAECCPADVTRDSTFTTHEAASAKPRRKKKPLPSFLPEYVEATPDGQVEKETYVGVAPNTDVTSASIDDLNKHALTSHLTAELSAFSRMSTEMQDDLGLKPPCTSPVGQALLERKAAFQRRHRERNPAHEEINPAVSMPAAQRPSDTLVFSDTVSVSITAIDAENIKVLCASNTPASLSFKAMKHSWRGHYERTIVIDDSANLMTTNCRTGQATNSWPLDRVVSAAPFGEVGLQLRVSAPPMSILAMLTCGFRAEHHLYFTLMSPAHRDQLAAHINHKATA